MKKLIFLFLVLATVIHATNITYSVVSLTQDSQKMVVIVDKQVYPLYPSTEIPILHIGLAPVANEGYKYAMLENTITLSSENFNRSPVNRDTVNEYYNRTWNKFDLDKLPVILPPLPIINRIDSDLHIDGQIPTIHFVGDQAELDAMHANQTNKNLKTVVKMSYISLDKAEVLENVKLQISGESTRSYPKLSYKIKIPKKQNLFGYRKLKLRAMLQTDYSYMKELLVYDMYNSVGLPTSKFSYVRLYINNEPIGLFGLVENFKNSWLRNEFANGDKDYKQGTLFVADLNQGKPKGEANVDTNVIDRHELAGMVARGGADLSYLGDKVSRYSLGFYSVKAKPSKEDADFTSIMNLTKFIFEASNTTTDDSVVPLWEEAMDVTSFLRGMAMEILISNSDGYFTFTNNYMLYEVPESRRISFSAQDFDSSMGFISLPEFLNGNYTQYPNFLRRPLTKILNVPKFKRDFEALLRNITTGLINERVLIHRIDQLYNMLKDDVEWDRSLPRKGRFMLDFFSNNIETNSTAINKHKTGSTQGNDYVKQFFDYLTYGVSFNEAVNGPMPSNIKLTLPLKDWVRIRSKNILDFLNQSR